MAGSSTVAEGARQAVRHEALRLAAAGEIDELVAAMADQHDAGDLFPGDVLVALAADALALAGTSRERPIDVGGIRERHLPEHRFSGSTAHQKSWTAVKAVAMTHAGLQPDLVEDAGWWRADDFWRYATLALVIYVRAAAEHSATSVADICEQLRNLHGLP